MAVVGCPKILSSFFCFARLAKFGPCVGAAFLIPAPELADDQRLLKTSLPPDLEALDEAGFTPLPKEGIEARPGFAAPGVEVAEADCAWTEV